MYGTEEFDKEFKDFERMIEAQAADKYNCPGIYSISVGGKLIYIGKSQKVEERIANHLLNIYKEGDDQAANKYTVIREAMDLNLPIGFDLLYKSNEVEENKIQEDIGYQEGVLIRQYLPPCNYQIPREGDWRKFTINKKAKTITLKEIMGTN